MSKAFSLRVKAECADTEIAAKMVSALSTMTGLQDSHSGVILYHFCRPDPETRPLYYEYIEIYGNEEAFFGHSSDMKFMEAYSSIWPTDKMTSITYGYGVMSEKVKNICDNFLFCRYPSEKSGFVLTEKPLNRESSLEGDAPVLLVGHIQAKEGKAADILSSIAKLSSEANDGVVVCFANVPENESAPNDVDFLELCTNNRHLLSHLGSPVGKSALAEIRNNSTEVKFRTYGTLLPESTRVLEDAGVTVATGEMVTGYVLHPNADQNGQ